VTTLEGAATLAAKGFAKAQAGEGETRRLDIVRKITLSGLAITIDILLLLRRRG
jgi:hypothetical protein